MVYSGIIALSKTPFPSGAAAQLVEELFLHKNFEQMRRHSWRPIQQFFLMFNKCFKLIYLIADDVKMAWFGEKQRENIFEMI